MLKALNTATGAPLLTGAGAPIQAWLVPLPLLPANPTQAGTPSRVQWPQALLTSNGFPLRTASGALLWTQLPLPPLRFSEPDPQTTRTALPQALLTSFGTPLRTARGAPLFWGQLPLPPLRFSEPDPQATRTAQPQALLTNWGAPLRTATGVALLWGQLPLPLQILPTPDPQATRIAWPQALRTARGGFLLTSLGALVLPGFIPFPGTRVSIVGVTRDLNGAALGNCAVALYLTRNDALVDRVTSDASGNYTFTTTGLSETYYVVAYLAGSPDVAGTTVNTLTGA